MALSDKQRKHFEQMKARSILRAERLARSRLASDVASVSNNSKWLKVFDSLKSQIGIDAKSVIKLLKQDESWEYSHILASVFEKTYFDGMSGPLNYSEIEWLEIECDNIPVFDFQVDMEEGDGFVIIYGYRTRHS